MSEPVDYMVAQEAGGGRRAWAVSEIFSWLVVLLAVAVMFGTPLVLGSKSPASVEKASEFQPGIQTLLGSRYLVGLNSVYPLKAAKQDEATLTAMQRSARGPYEKFRMAIVRGELQGKEAGLEAAGRLAPESRTVAKDVETLKALYAGEAPADVKGWEDFHERHGWFAELAASTGKPAGDALRQSTIGEAIRTMVVLVVMVMIVLALGLIGLPMLIIGMVLFFKRRLVPAFGRIVELPADRRAYVQGFAFYLGTLAAVATGVRVFLWLRPEDARLGLWMNVLLPVAFLLGFLWPLFRGQRWRELRAATGLHTGRGVLREMLCGVAGYIAGIPIFAVGIAITFVLTKWSGLDSSHPIVNQLHADPWRIAIIFALASVFAPITEELMFRGALFGHLRERYGFWISAVAVALVFAIIHPQGWPAIPALASLALVFAGIREWRGSIIGCMTAHALNNTAVLIMVVLMLS
jgi:membrane protease YdiL (CAAX protease family)